MAQSCKYASTANAEMLQRLLAHSSFQCAQKPLRTRPLQAYCPGLLRASVRNVTQTPSSSCRCRSSILSRQRQSRSDCKGCFIHRSLHTPVHKSTQRSTVEAALRQFLRRGGMPPYALAADATRGLARGIALAHADSACGKHSHWVD